MPLPAAACANYRPEGVGACSGDVKFHVRYRDGRHYPRCEIHAKAWYRRLGL